MTALLTLSLVLLAPAPGPAALKWKLEKGTTFYAKNSVLLKQTVTVMGNDQEQEQDQVSYSKFEVLSADEKGFTIEQTMEKSEVKGNMPGAADAAKKMKGVVLTYTLNEKFEVKKVKGIDDMFDKLAGDNPAARKMIASMLSEDLFAVGIAEFFRTAPDKPVRVKDTWKRDFKYPLGGGLGSLKMDAEYKFAKSADGGDTVTWSAKTKYEVGEGGGDLPFTFTGGELTAEEFTGEYVFDSKLGRLKSNSSRAKINGTLTLSVQGKEIEMKLKQNIKTTCTFSDKSMADD